MNQEGKILQHILALRLRFVFLAVIVLFIITDIFVQRLEKSPNLILRNDGRTHIALPYMFRQMAAKKNDTVIAFLGASEVQGIMNTTPETTVTSVIQKQFDTKGVRARCFNLAAIGNNLGDNLAIGTEAARNGANILVFPLHFKLFSGVGTLNVMTCYSDTPYYLRDMPNFDNLRRGLLNTPDRNYQETVIEKFIEKHWALYRERSLLSYLVYGTGEPPLVQLRLWLYKALNIVEINAKADLPIWKYDTPEERNIDNLWRVQPKSYHENNADCYKSVKLDFSDRHFQLLKMIAELPTKYDVKVVFFFVPLNRTAVNQFKYFSWDRHEQFKRMVEEVAKENDITVFDLTDAVDNRFFSDGDHLNMNGHAQEGAVLAAALEPMIAGAKP